MCRYGLARNMHRKIIFHAGPTNSGKTYHALQRFKQADSGIYCGPLRLLAMEVYDKCMKDVRPIQLFCVIQGVNTFISYYVIIMHCTVKPYIRRVQISCACHLGHFCMVLNSCKLDNWNKSIDI